MNVSCYVKLTGYTQLTFVTGNGSDVFGSDICTCKPYLTYAIEECVRGAQRGGVGLVVYFRKEGRALGEVTKCAFIFDHHVPQELTDGRRQVPGVQLAQAWR